MNQPQLLFQLPLDKFENICCFCALYSEIHKTNRRAKTYPLQLHSEFSA